MSDLAKLEKRIGYHFRSKALLAQSVTHRSYGEANNERLEFLGDSILNFVIAADLFTRFPDASEGELSRLRASLVKQPTLADLAREIDLGSYLTMGTGELKSGGFERDSILSDSLEAIIGAILLDSDFNSASDRVLAWFESRLNSISSHDPPKDPKSTLQEYLQGLGEPVPNYVLVKKTGKSPNQEFEIECRSAHFADPVRASGTSIRKAEQSAAEATLKRLGISV